MWSLYKKTNRNTEHPTPNTEFLEPLLFSNGKTQSDVVQEILDSIEKGNKLIFIKGVCGTGKCLEKNTQIFCKPNNENFFSYHSIKSLTEKEGKILSLDKEGKIVESKFSNVRKTKTKKIYKLTTKTGRSINTSINHPFLTITKKGTEWKPLVNLSTSSFICLPNKISLNENDANENEAKILAHLIAEGKLGDKASSPRYYQCPKQNPQVRADYINALKSLFPEGKIISKNFETTISFYNMNTTKGTTNKLRLLIKKHNLDGKKSNEKFIPPFIINSNKKTIALFLKTIFSCDGSIYQKNTKNRIKKQTIIEYCSISKQLIKDISILLNIMEIQHTITTKSFKDKKGYSQRIQISSQPELIKFINSIGFIGRKMKIAKKILPNLLNHKFTNLDKIPNIIRDYLKEKNYSISKLDRYLNYEEIEKFRKIKNYKLIKKDNSIQTPTVLKQPKINYLRQHLKTINKHLKDETIDFICSPDIIWDKIKSIELISEDETYDLEVENNHNFIADGIIVHNSAIALNLAKHFKKTSIVVPIKSLQEQYEKDYTDKKYILKKDNKPLNIAVIKGRNNFPCKFGGDKADDPEIPCVIEIKEKNTDQLLKYINQNPEVQKEEFSTASDIRRMNIAPVCPYWAPIMPANINPKGLTDTKKIKYDSISGKEFALFQRKKGCPYVDQYEAYAKADVLIFNSMKYQIESQMGRKPKTELDVIDECDEFLDSFSQERKINLNKLQTALNNLTPKEKEKRNAIKELIHTINDITFSKIPNDIEKIKKTRVIKIIETALKNPNLAEDEELNYYNTLVEIARSFEDLLDETYISIEQTQPQAENQKNIFSDTPTHRHTDTPTIINLVSINLAEKLQKLIEQNNILVMMSGTLHSEQVLKDIFGLKNFVTIEAETKNPGKIIKKKTGQERNCSFANFKNNTITRNQYLKIMDMQMSIAKQPTVVHVSAFKDLPSEEENAKLKLDNLITQEKLKQLQSRGNKNVNEFKNKETDILFTTKCSRGINFAGESCNSILITRFPYPNIQGLFWKILKKEQPEKFMKFYMDKARRELIQKVARGVRFKGDKVDLYSPDSRVLSANLD